jgi:hypothetical protein
MTKCRPVPVKRTKRCTKEASGRPHPAGFSGVNERFLPIASLFYSILQPEESSPRASTLTAARSGSTRHRWSSMWHQCPAVETLEQVTVNFVDACLLQAL